MRAAIDNYSEIERAIRDIRNFTEAVTVVLNRPDPELQVLPLELSSLPFPAVTPELSEILKEMRRLSSTAVAILARPTSDVSNPQFNAAPIVNVAAPSVTVNPNIRVEQPPARRYRITVESRDSTAQQRAKTFLIEPLD